MKINLFWSFSEAIEHIRTIRDYYISLLSSFSIYELRQRNIAQREIRSQIYSLDILEWQKDKLWEYINGDIPYTMLTMLGNRQR